MFYAKIFACCPECGTQIGFSSGDHCERICPCGKTVAVKTEYECGTIHKTAVIKIEKTDLVGVIRNDEPVFKGDWVYPVRADGSGPYAPLYSAAQVIDSTDGKIRAKSLSTGIRLSWSPECLALVLRSKANEELARAYKQMQGS